MSQLNAILGALKGLRPSDVLEITTKAPGLITKIEGQLSEQADKCVALVQAIKNGGQEQISELLTSLDVDGLVAEVKGTFSGIENQGGANGIA